MNHAQSTISFNQQSRLKVTKPSYQVTFIISVYLLSTYSIRIDTHGTNYYYSRLYALAITKMHMANKEKSYLYQCPFTTRGSRETTMGKMPRLGAYALGGLEPPTLLLQGESSLHYATVIPLYKVCNY